MTEPTAQLVIYEPDDASRPVEVRLERETVWLSLNQMAELFERDKSVISRHLRNVFVSGELAREAVVAKNATTAADGKTYQIEHFNLDAIIAVGYRVNSKRGTQFRIWATRTLQNQALVNDTGRAVLELITGYADTWRLLLEYDEDRLVLPPGAKPSSGVLDVARASLAIADFKRELLVRHEATSLFGNPRGAALDGILGSIRADHVRRGAVPHARGEGCPSPLLRHQGSPVFRWQQTHRFLPVHALPATGRHGAPTQPTGPDRTRLAHRRKRPGCQGADDLAHHQSAGGAWRAGKIDVRFWISP